MKKHNFNPGPSILPPFTVENTVKAIMDLNGSGLGLMEVSHRGKDFQAIIDETVALFKELLGIPEGYSVIFLGGGASLQFAMVPYNMLEKKAGYLVTGEWAKKAHKEAKFFGETVVVASSEDKNFNYIPRGFNVPKDLDYLHVTTNNTIFGTELFEDYNFGVPLVADMSSDILSRSIDVSKYVLIYGGAQKNLGPAGVTFVIAKNDAVGNVTRPIPTMLQYKLHIEKGSLYNTPPVVPIYACLQTLKWLKNMGGVSGIEKLNIRKSDMLYNEIDTNPLFKATIADKRDRSRMNICWVMKDEYKPLEQAFQDFATSRGMVGIKGHRSVGGFRASFYNALPIESAQALIDTMREFAKQNG